MNTKTHRTLLGMTYAAVIAALYVALTFLSSLFGLSGQGAVQLRISEALTVLPYFTAAAVPGVTLGCLLANLLTGAAALGLLWTMPRLTPAAPSPGTYGEITGFVYGEPKQRSDERLTFTLTDIRLDGERVSGRAYCSLYYEGEEPPELYDGAELRFEGRVYQPDGKSGAPRFDFRQWMLKNGCKTNYHGS